MWIYTRGKLSYNHYPGLAINHGLHLEQLGVALTAEAVEKGTLSIITFLIFVIINPPKTSHNQL